MTVVFTVPLYGPCGSAAYETPDGVVASTTVGRVTTPSAQVACVTSGAAGCTGVHVTAVRPTLNVAVVAFTSVHVFGDAMPPVTAFKWSIGHLIAAAGRMYTVIALAALADDVADGIATLSNLDPDCAGIAVSNVAQMPRSKVALILCRGFAGTDAALVVKAA